VPPAPPRSALGMTAQLTTNQRSLLPTLAAEIDARIGNGTDAHGYPAGGAAEDECFGCVPGDPHLGSYCDTFCLTPCEIDLVARSLLPSAPSGAEPFGAEVAAMRAFVFKQESWICRYSSEGIVRSYAHHADVWFAGEPLRIQTRALPLPAA
jgi:hypothetical protein